MKKRYSNEFSTMSPSQLILTPEKRQELLSSGKYRETYMPVDSIEEYLCKKYPHYARKKKKIKRFGNTYGKE